MKDFIELILPYYAIFVVVLVNIGIVSMFIKDMIIKTFGSCIYLDEVDMIVKNKKIESVQRRDNDGNLNKNNNYYYLYLEKPGDANFHTKLKVSSILYHTTCIGDIVKMHEMIYKYKDVYMRKIVQYSNHNISKYNKCSDNDKNSFNLFKTEILNKCNDYNRMSGDKMKKTFPFLVIPVVLLFLMAFYINS